MKLQVLLPTQLLVDVETCKVSAEAPDGCFTLLPHHIDLVSGITPGLLSYTRLDGEEVFLAVDEGILVKQGDRVLVSTLNAVTGPDLGTLRHTVQQQYRHLDEHERTTRAVLARLENHFVQRFMELGTQ